MSEELVRRNTRQRQAILEELREMRSHPTAGELYRSVRQRLPRISLGTVYRNLDILAETGQVVKLASADQEARYDGNPAPHAHLQCEACGRIEDVELVVPALAELARSEIHGYRISTYSLLFAGMCPACRFGN